MLGTYWGRCPGILHKTLYICVVLVTNIQSRTVNKYMWRGRNAYSFHAVFAGEKVVVADPAEWFTDKSLKHLVHRKQNVLGSRSLHRDQQLGVA